MKFSKGDGILSTLLIYSAIAAVVLLSMTLAFAAFFFYAGEASISNIVSWWKVIILFGLGMGSGFLTRNFSVRRLLPNFCAFWLAGFGI